MFLQIVKFVLAISNEIGVEEVAINKLNYDPKVYNEHIELSNVIVKPDRLIMRSSISSSALIRWDIPNDHEEFAFEVTFNEPNLDASESISLYFFYTKERAFLGDFKGGPSKFTGIVGGIEIEGKSIELGYATNENLDLSGVEIAAFIKDAINPMLFKNINELRMKIIMTKKNIKYEIYSGDKLLYDNLRFFDASELNRIKKGYFLSLFANYMNVSAGKAIEIKQAQLYKRTETEAYDKTKSYTKKEVKKLSSKEIKHSNKDLKIFIKKLYFIIEMVENHLGHPPKAVLKLSEDELAKEFEIIESKLKIILESQGVTKKQNPARLNEISKNIELLKKQIIAIEYSLEIIKENKESEKTLLAKVAMIFGTISIGILLIKEMSVFKTARKL